jgi:hypothetical protein
MSSNLLQLMESDREFQASSTSALLQASYQCPHCMACQQLVQLTQVRLQHSTELVWSPELSMMVFLEKSSLCLYTMKMFILIIAQKNQVYKSYKQIKFPQFIIRLSAFISPVFYTSHCHHQKFYLHRKKDILGLIKLTSQNSRN